MIFSPGAITSFWKYSEAEWLLKLVPKGNLRKRLIRLRQQMIWSLSRSTPDGGTVPKHFAMQDGRWQRLINFVPKKIWSERYDLINVFEKKMSESDNVWDRQENTDYETHF